MKRTVLFVLTGLFASALLMGPAPATASPGPIRLSYANFPPAPTFPCVQMERWKEVVEERTGGKVLIDTYPGGTLLDAKSMMDGVIAGQADIGCLCMAYQPGRFTLTNATALPLGFPDAETASLALWALYEKYQPEEFRNVKVLTMFTSAPANIYSNRRVAGLEDLRGLELRASGGVAEVLRALGATPVGMPQSEAPEALQRGVVQGAVSSLETLMDFKYAEMCRQVTIFDGPIYPFAVVMNRKVWDSLPEDVRKVMDDLRLEQAEWTGRYMDEHVERSIEWSLENYDIEITHLSDQEKAIWDERLEPIIQNWISEADSKGLPGAEIVEFLNGFINQ